MAEPARTMSFEDAAELDPDDQAGELDAGRWRPVTKSTWAHGRVMLAVGALLHDYSGRVPGWSVAVGDPGTRLRRSPDTLRGPDVAIVRKEREPTGHGVEGWLDGAPDVAIEILRDTQSVSALTKKALEYLAAGGRSVWILDPEPGRAVIFTAPNRVRVLSRDEILEDEALPGFRCTVGELFDE